MKAFIYVDILILKDKRYSVGTLSSLPSHLPSAQGATPHIGDDTRAFFGQEAPLSSFHTCTFNIDGIGYHTAEQRYEDKKRNYSKDIDCVAKIRKFKTALACYRKGKNLTKKIDLNAWHAGPALDAM